MAKTDLIVAVQWIEKGTVQKAEVIGENLALGKIDSLLRKGKVASTAQIQVISGNKFMTAREYIVEAMNQKHQAATIIVTHSNGNIDIHRVSMIQVAGKLRALFDLGYRLDQIETFMSADCKQAADLMYM